MPAVAAARPFCGASAWPNRRSAAGTNETVQRASGCLLLLEERTYRGRFATAGFDPQRTSVKMQDLAGGSSRHIDQIETVMKVSRIHFVLEGDFRKDLLDGVLPIRRQ